MFRLLKTESFKLSNKLKSWLGPLLIMVLVLIAFPLSIDISQYDLEKFYFSIIVISLLMTSFVATEGMFEEDFEDCLLYTSPSPRDQRGSRMPSSA